MSQRIIANPDCPTCGGSGHAYKRDAEGKIVYTNGGLTPEYTHCPCVAPQYAALRQKKLARLDGLTDEERLRTFETMIPISSQANTVKYLSQVRHGLLTLQGAPGLGKSHLLHCKVNQMREEGKVAVYATMPDILDYLRRAFDPKADVSFGERWDLLITCDVLAIDELDEFSNTAWAQERFLRLIDERYRNQRKWLTLMALNGDVERLHPKVISRINGGMIKLVGKDLRRVQA